MKFSFESLLAEAKELEKVDLRNGIYFQGQLNRLEKDRLMGLVVPTEYEKVLRNIRNDMRGYSCEVFTHVGTFHADEVMAIATLFCLGETPKITRAFQVPEGWEGFVFDIGGVYDGITRFDHHQDPTSPATNLLVLEAFCKDEKLKSHLRPFYQMVSDVDCGKQKSPVGGFSQIISNFNQLENGFDKALDCAVEILQAAFQTARECVRLESKWEKLERVNPTTVLSEDTEFIPNWKELAERDDIIFMVSPNLRGGWQIMTRNSDLATIPVHPDQTFRHNSGFMAVYGSKENLLNHLGEF